MKARITLFLVWFLLFLPENSNAQLRGRVIDTSGNPLADAIVTFTSPTDSTLSFSGVTDDNGDYHIYYNLVSSQKPSSVVLEQNYPNPFNPSTTINFFLPENGFAEIVVYNVLGHRIRTLANREYSSGQHQVIWDGKDENGRGVSAGVYVYQLRSAGIVETKKMLMVDGSGAGGFSAGPSPRPSTPEMVLDATVTSDLIIPFTKRVTIGMEETDFVVCRKNIAITCSATHVFVQKNDGSIWSWGSNNYGQLGDGTTINRMTPERINWLDNVKYINLRGGYSAVIKDDLTGWHWGKHKFLNATLSPVLITEVQDITKISQAIEYAVTLKADSTVWAWGFPYLYPIHKPAWSDSFFYVGPDQVKDLNSIIDIKSGSSHSLALKSDGTVYAWGENDFQQLGKRISGKQVDIDSVKAIAAGMDHNVVLKEDGSVWAWGYNHTGQIGDGTVSGYYFQGVSTPTRALIDDVVKVSAGGFTSMALKRDGSVWQWGWDYFDVIDEFQHGDNWVPEKIEGLPVITTIVCGGVYSMAIDTDGRIWAWGRNGSGQLGDGTTTDRLTPIRVPDF